METEEEDIHVPNNIYRRLLNDSMFLTILQNYGVDNWEGYELARDEFHTNGGT